MQVILTVGALKPRKGIDIIIKSLPLILKEAPEVELVIVGEGEQSTYWNLAKDLAVADRITIKTNLPNEELKNLFRKCSVFALTPRYIDHQFEGYGLVYLEAGLYKKPVVGSRSGGVPDAVIDGETGLLIQENDPPATAAAIVKILKDPELAKKLGEGGYRLARERNWDDYIEKVIKIYEAATK